MKYTSVLKHINRNTVSLGKLINRISLTKCYRKKKRLISAFPSVLQIEVTSICNLACVMCPSAGLKRPRGNMDISLFEKIMKEAAGKSELAILHLMGEPLINREIVKMIPLCKKANIKSVISTNAMLLNDEMANAICSSGLDTIILSFDGVSKETFEKVRFKAKYDTVKNNIERFLKRKHKPHTVVQMISFDLTDSERSQFKELWKGYNVDVLIKPYTNWQGDNDQINSWCRTDIAGLRYRTCDRLWKWATITQNGTMIPCCRDYDATVPFGNIKDHSIANIWNGSEFQNFRMQHSLGRERCSICKNCDYRAIIYDNFLAQLGTTVFDSYAILRLMYDMNYLSSE